MAPIPDADWQRVRRQLARLMKGLNSTTSQDETQKVKQAITHAVLSGQAPETVDPPSNAPAGPSDPSPQVERGEGLVLTDNDMQITDSFRPADQSLIVAQTVRLRPFGVHESSQLFVRGGNMVKLVPDSTFGPLVDVLGRRLELVVWKQTPFTLLRDGLYMNTTLTPMPPNPYLSSFGPCTVWVPASLFDPSAPAGYVGLRAKSGTAVSPPAPFSGVTVELEQPAAAWDGPLATRFARSVPSTMTISVSEAQLPQKATLSTTAMNFTATMFGNNTAVNLQYTGGAAEYDTALQRLLFPLTTDTTELNLTETDADLVHFSGKAQITKAYWALPVVPFPTKPLFAPVAGNGAVIFRVSPGLRSRFLDDRDTWTYGDVEVAVDETAASIFGLTAWTSATRSLDIWMHGNPQARSSSGQKIKRSTLTLKSMSLNVIPLKRGFPFQYIVAANGQESWTYSTAISASLSAPISISGTRTSFTGAAAVLFTRQKPGFLPRVSIEGRRTENEFDNKDHASYLMENMLLSVSYMRGLFAYGEYSWGDRSIVTGSVNLPAGLVNAIPTLPDPYATNFYFAAPEVTSVMMIQLRFDGRSDVKAAVQLANRPFGDVRALDSSEFDTRPDNGTAEKFKLPASKLENDLDHHDIAPWSDQYNSLQPFLRNDPALLDVSTNVSQLGISFSPFEVSISVTDENGMIASTGAANLKMFCLPTVHWEALYVDVPPPEQAISLRNQTTSFGTKMATASVDLVPITPRDLLAKTVAAYNPAPFSLVQPAPVTVHFQLPFGMLAQATAPAESPRKRVKLVQPAFDKEPLSFTPGTSEKITMTGAPQISFRSLSSDQSASFQGTALLPYQDLSPFVPVITDQFNADFTSKVPVSGFDISGYGLSMFSEWALPQPIPTTGISKVSLDVIVGRTSREIVQMSSIMYPYGVRVIRTVTILRLNNGRIVGQDSGWVAASDGSYDFGEPQAGHEKLKVHFGLVRGVKQVTNIRLMTAGNDNLVNFDCFMEIEGNEAGGGLVSAQGQVGYIVTRDSSAGAQAPKALTAEQYLAVIDDIQTKNGVKLGGPVDCVVKLGNSEQKMRVSRVLVGSCDNTGATDAAGHSMEFPMELWGTPIVPASGGQWAFTTSLPTGEFGKTVQGAVDSWGVPLVRKGLAVADSLSQAIRVADGASLFLEKSAYNLIHSADSHRLMFPSPELIPGAVGEVVEGLTSKVPLLADGFALASSTGGIFPDLETCIPLEGASTVLKVLEGGHYEYKTLAQEGAKLALTEVTRTLKENGEFASAVSTAGRLLPDGVKVPAEVDLAISTIKGVKDMSLSNIAMITKGAAGGELSRVAGDILSSATNLPVFKNPENIFGPLLGQVQKVVNFLNKLKVLPPLKVSMTNEWALEVSTSMGLDDFLKKLGPGAAAIKEIVQVLNFALKARTTPTSANFVMSVDVTIKIPTGLGPTVLGVGGFKVKAGTDGNLVEMTIGAGIGVDIKVGPFGASAYYTQSQSIIVSKEIYGVAATCVLKVHVNLVVASADLMLEARLGLIGGPCADEIHQTHAVKEDTIYVYAQVRIALHVSIFLVINVSVDETAEWENNMNKGPCLLKDMKPMP
ncbi:hypothetical protein B0H66DRAFT_633074 [Apodospora peruviana]|uniref:Uncharacterized protein n=1 Tax=Apodospora peruviana TaxID=516989 RepID=A0AAE0HTG1_9PEZI|nr:hypothetical protein B0H66DRAFT_633074 [Apodospora peruviana]